MLGEQPTGEQVHRRCRQDPRQLEQQRTQQVRDHDRRAGAIGRSAPERRLRAKVSAAQLDVHPVGRGVGPGRGDALALVIDRQHGREAKACGGDRQHPRAGADVHQRAEPELELRQ